MEKELKEWDNQKYDGNMHFILSRIDTKSTIFVTILSLIMTAIGFIKLPWDESLVSYICGGISITLLLLIIAPYYIGWKNKGEFNIWRVIRKKEIDTNQIENNEFSKKLSLLVIYKSILFWVATLSTIIGIFTVMLMEVL